ncbi:MAG: type II toxin-antitoxin system VapC family toxin [Elusimicrobia bacterium]|nr:type II toxin-antitoxin system VapC family toxin [Elusimicrobiota bacterium]
MRLFLDSSALAKRYVAEAGSDQVLLRCRQADEICVSVLCVPELVSGFNRLRREGHLSARRYRELKENLAADLEQATVLDLSSAVIDRAISCLERAPLRALDALQLASAMESRCQVLLTADRRQREGASKMRLEVELVGAPS